MIGNLVGARGDGDGALAEELRTLNEEYAEVEGQVREIDGQVEGIADGGPTEDEVRDALQKLDPVSNELFPAERERIVKLLLKEAVLSAEGLDIAVRTNGLRSLAMELTEGAGAKVAEDGATVTVHVPMTFKVHGGRREIISPQRVASGDLPPDAATTPDVGPRRPIVVTLARAHRWQEMLDTGQVSSMLEVAGRYGVDRSHVGRILRLTSLAPDIVEAIVTGDEPSGLSVAKLQRDLPAAWEKQRQALLFGSPAE